MGDARNGDVLRNRGCQMTDGQRWCGVERPDGSGRGWVAGRYLRESSGAPSQANPSDALVPGTNYHATGQIPAP